jgi:hypothetical protein
MYASELEELDTVFPKTVPYEIIMKNRAQTDHLVTLTLWCKQDMICNQGN